VEGVFGRELFYCPEDGSAGKQAMQAEEEKRGFRRQDGRRTGTSCFNGSKTNHRRKRQTEGGKTPGSCTKPSYHIQTQMISEFEGFCTLL